MQFKPKLFLVRKQVPIIRKGSKPFFDLLEELKIPDNQRHFLTK